MRIARAVVSSTVYPFMVISGALELSVLVSRSGTMWSSSDGSYASPDETTVKIPLRMLHLWWGPAVYGQGDGLASMGHGGDGSRLRPAERVMCYACSRRVSRIRTPIPEVGPGADR